MYHLINAHIDNILKQIPMGHVSGYDYLHSNRHNLGSSDFQRRFKAFWALNAARLSEDFCNHYFDLLKEASAKKQGMGIGEILNILHREHTNGVRKSLQFSFASKLLHTVDDHAPIFDSNIAGFFFYEVPGRKTLIPQRIDEFAAFYKFLADEYSRIIEKGLLTKSILKFRQQFKPQSFTDEKVIDSLIWSFVSLQRKGAAVRKEVIYC